MLLKNCVLCSLLHEITERIGLSCLGIGLLKSELHLHAFTTFPSVLLFFTCLAASPSSAVTVRAVADHITSVTSFAGCK